MNCQDFEKEYLQADGTLSSEASAHTKTCRSCRELVQILNLLSAAAQTPSPELDRKTVSAALYCMRRQHTRWSARIQTFLYAAAAALILLLGVLSFHFPKPANEQMLASNTQKPQQKINVLQTSAEPLADLEALWYLNREETRSELDNLELELYLYANSP